MQRLRNFVSGIETSLSIIGASVIFLAVFFGLIMPNTKSLRSEIVVHKKNLNDVSVDLVRANETIAQLELDYSRDLNELQRSIDCSRADQFSPDYSSNAAMVTALTSYLEDTEGPVDSWRWNSIWDSSQDSIHYQIGEFQYVFLMYFEDVDLNNPNGVFWLDQLCWLDKAEN